MMTTTRSPRVWIADLAAYNAGCLHGEWVDATDMDAMTEAGERLIKTSPVWAMGMSAEELAIHDYDEFPSGVVSELGEYPDWATVVNVATLLEAHGDAFADFLEAIEGIDLATVTEDDFQASYRGEFDSEKDYAYQYVDECGWGGLQQIPDELSGYIDWDAIARDLFDHGSYTYRNGRVFEEEV